MSTMDCFRAREGLWPPERPRLAGTEVLEARTHVEHCAACCDYFAQDRALLQLYDRLRHERAPDLLRQRVFAALARVRAGGVGTRAGPERAGTPSAAWSRRATRAAGLASVLALALTAWLLSGRSHGASADHAIFIEDYLRRAVSDDHIITSDPAEVGRFLARELGLPLTPPRVRGLQLTRAEICLLEGRRGAMILYLANGRTLSHYLIPRQGAKARPPSLPNRGRLARAGGGSPTVITWATPAVEQALVGDLEPAQLLALAKNFAPTQ